MANAKKKNERDDDFGVFMIKQNPKLKAELDKVKADAKKKAMDKKK